MTVQLKSVVTRQIPEFVRSDYPYFVEFVKAYYEYLDQYEKRDLEATRDIDETLDEYIEYFRKELDILGTLYPHIDNRLFLRKSKELFTAKGTEGSYKFLLKILFNKTADITYPWDKVLKVSSGQWEQENSMFISLIEGDVYQYVGKTVTVVAPNVRINIYVSRVVDIDSANGVYELFFDKNYNGVIDTGHEIELVENTILFDGIKSVSLTNNTISHTAHAFVTGDPVTYNFNGGKEIGGLIAGEGYFVIKVDANTIRLASTYENAINNRPYRLTGNGIGVVHTLTKSTRTTILPTTVKYTIVSKGSGFKQGDLLDVKTVSNGRVIESKLKVTKVDSIGGILGLATIKFGYGYDTPFFNMQPSASGKKSLSYSSRITNTKNGSVQYSIPNDSVIKKYEDYGYAIRPDYAEVAPQPNQYVVFDYSGELLQQFYDSSATGMVSNTENILINFDIGAVAKYPGHYISNEGFLDNDIFIQDSYKWQKYSYLITINEKLSAYKDIVKSLLHPAGTAMFGEYSMINTYTPNLGGLQQLGMWKSKATFGTINKSMNSAVPVFDAGGQVRLDPYDLDYAMKSQYWNPPTSVELTPGNWQLKAFKFGNNVLEDSVTMLDSTTTTYPGPTEP